MPSKRAFMLKNLIRVLFCEKAFSNIIVSLPSLMLVITTIFIVLI